jgi:hypothetical protein
MSEAWWLFEGGIDMRSPATEPRERRYSAPIVGLMALFLEGLTGCEPLEALTLLCRFMSLNGHLDASFFDEVARKEP